jgi:hypothetical protein
MKFPTLTRLPKYKRFNVEPRYYDPVKEDIDERTSRIMQEISQPQDGIGPQRSSISGAFSKRASYERNSSILQSIILVLLVTFIVGYLFYGNAIFYLLLLAIPVYVLFRIKKYPIRRR